MEEIKQDMVSSVGFGSGGAILAYMLEEPEPECMVQSLYMFRRHAKSTPANVHLNVLDQAVNIGDPPLFSRHSHTTKVAPLLRLNALWSFNHLR